MPRFYFDLHDGEWDRDAFGTELPGITEAILEAKRTLPAMTVDDLPKTGDRHTVTMLVTDHEGRPVYTATLTYTGSVLARE